MAGTQTHDGNKHNLKDELSHYSQSEKSRSCADNTCQCLKSLQKHSNAIKSAASVFYDFLTMFVSILDFITDILVMIEYYNKGYDYFYAFSLTILIFAQLSYCIAFANKSNRNSDICAKILVFICSIPFAPILSFVFYFTADPDSCLSKFLRCGLPRANTHLHNRSGIRSNQNNQNKSQFREWFENKLNKHIGFILEAACEAFPQSILQMIAIVYYNETNNVLAIVSIFISLFSVINKSFIFSVSAGKDFLTIMFYWLSAITDFFGIFFTVTWVFYNPTEHDNKDLISTVIGYIWLYKFLICVLPIVLMITFGLLTVVIQRLYDGLDCSYSWRHKTRYCNCCVLLCSLLCTISVASFVIGLLMIVLPIIFEIFVFLYIAMYFEVNYMSRFPKDNANDLKAWQKLTSFIYQNKGYDITDIANEFEQFNLNLHDNNVRNVQTPYICTAKQDRIIRICCINYGYLKGFSLLTGAHAEDVLLLRYLQDQQVSSFCNVAEYDEILLHSSRGGIEMYMDYGNDNNDNNNNDSTNDANSGKTNGNEAKIESRKIPMWRKFWFIWSSLWVQMQASVDDKKAKLKTNIDANRSYVSTGDEFEIIMLQMAKYAVGSITFALGPLYAISRCISFIFPIIIIVYLLIDSAVTSSNIWHSIDILQWGMLIIYSVLVVIVLILIGFMLYYSYYESFIMPNNNLPSLHKLSNEFAEYVTDYCYPQLMIAPIRDYLVRQAFGRDVGSIILLYIYGNKNSKMKSSSTTVDTLKDFMIKYKGKDANDKMFRKFQETEIVIKDANDDNDEEVDEPLSPDIDQVISEIK